MPDKKLQLTTYTDLPNVRIIESTTKAENLLAVLEDWSVSAENLPIAGELLKDVHLEIKQLDELRLAAGKPAREAQRDINNFFKPALEAYKKAKNQITKAIDTYQRQLAEHNAAAISAASQGDSQALARIVPDRPVAGVRMRNVVEIEILDEAAIPREYLMVDRGKLRDLAQSGGEAPPGVKFLRSTKAGVGR